MPKKKIPSTPFTHYTKAVQSLVDAGLSDQMIMEVSTQIMYAFRQGVAISFSEAEEIIAEMRVSTPERQEERKSSIMQAIEELNKIDEALDEITS